MVSAAPTCPRCSHEGEVQEYQGKIHTSMDAQGAEDSENARAKNIWPAQSPEAAGAQAVQVCAVNLRLPRSSPATMLKK